MNNPQTQPFYRNIDIYTSDFKISQDKQINRATISVVTANIQDLKERRATSKTKREREISQERFEKSVEKVDSLVQTWNNQKQNSLQNRNDGSLRGSQRKQLTYLESPRDRLIQRKSIDLDSSNNQNKKNKKLVSSSENRMELFRSQIQRYITYNITPKR
ncbi:hypothetical protein PPERSA_03625 [Pseudocohnilembus persalinus]|uniref:Uncharacterized protein n=1 Tax=Pseudocohnilembus persalinus TaxID=266149 RepID=A0A0V0QDY5_PSEPJ|nr:hypothetical protein PPERSA_03625 [Pseudocohnilembus persalinus]|eukprot:KRX00404.1 hypothetical protein PPERSA_03625 [Pseudocohnilembus persalinus]